MLVKCLWGRLVASWIRAAVTGVRCLPFPPRGILLAFILVAQDHKIQHSFPALAEFFIDDSQLALSARPEKAQKERFVHKYAGRVSRNSHIRIFACRRPQSKLWNTPAESIKQRVLTDFQWARLSVPYCTI